MLDVNTLVKGFNRILVNRILFNNIAIITIVLGFAVHAAFSARITDPKRMEMEGGEAQEDEAVPGLNLSALRSQILAEREQNQQIWDRLFEWDQQVLTNSPGTVFSIISEIRKDYPRNQLILERAVYGYAAIDQLTRSTESAAILGRQGRVNSHWWLDVAMGEYLSNNKTESWNALRKLNTGGNSRLLVKFYSSLVLGGDDFAAMPALSLQDSAYLLNHIVDHTDAFAQKFEKQGLIQLIGVLLAGGESAHPGWEMFAESLDPPELERYLMTISRLLAELHHHSIYGRISETDIQLAEEDHVKGPGLDLIKAVYLQQKGNLKEALAGYMKLHEQYPGFEMSGLRRFFALLDLHYDEEAERVGLEWMGANPQSPYSDFIKLCLLVQKNELDAARVAVREAYNTYGDLFQTWIKGGAEYQKKLRWIAYFELSVEEVPRGPTP